MARLRPLALLAALVAPALLSRDASAENGIKPRLPVTWEPPVSCLEFVDRSADPVYRFSYDIADEDPSPGEQLLEDEVADSRRHQFVALSRQGNPQTEFPHLWLSLDDVAAALERNLISESTVAPDETMDTSPVWAEHFFRITPDEERRPISNESVAAPVLWDTTSVDGGIYMLWGYTWEPAFNLWSPRVGNVVIVHDGDPTAVGPAAVVTNGELIVYSDETAVIEGCVHGSPGTTLHGDFALTPENGTPDDWEPDWIPFAQDIPADSDTFALDFLPGEDYATKTLLVRVIASDSEGRSYEAHMPELVNVLPGSAGGCDDGGGQAFIGNPGCGEEGSTGGSSGAETGDTTSNTSGASAATTGADTGGSETSGTSSAGAQESSGGTCAVGRGNGRFGWLLLGLLGLLRRRRDEESPSRPQARRTTDTAAVPVQCRHDRRVEHIREHVRREPGRHARVQTLDVGQAAS